MICRLAKIDFDFKINFSIECDMVSIECDMVLAKIVISFLDGFKRIYFCCMLNAELCRAQLDIKHSNSSKPMQQPILYGSY